MKRESILLVVILGVWGLSISAHADLWDGSGTEGNPYLIYTPAQMNMIGGSLFDYDKHFRLMANIDLSGYTGTSFFIIGMHPDYPFTGVFDGNGHTISNFTYTSSGIYYIGLFGWVGTGGEIKNLGMTNVNVDAGTGRYAGGLVGLNRGTVSNCYAAGNVGGDEWVGGLVGVNDGAVSNCYAAGSVTGEYVVGGLVGLNRGTVSNCYGESNISGVNDSVSLGGLVGGNYDGIISNCYAEGSVTGIDSSKEIGGLAGTNDGLIINCYSAANVNGGNESESVGGLVGLNGINAGNITNCYAYGRINVGNKSDLVGGLVGQGDQVINSYWDIQTSGILFSAGGCGKFTAELKFAMTFVGWNSCGGNTVWTLDEGNDYPRLVWENQTGTNIPAYSLSDFLAGMGTELNPYQINSASQMDMVGRFPCEWDKHFSLMSDIDLSAYAIDGFHIIGTSYLQSFAGVFDGNGHVIRNFFYSSGAIRFAGIFGFTGFGSVITDLGVENLVISCGSFSSCLGGLVGTNRGGTITNCYVKGSVDGGNNTESLGALVGRQANGGKITNCYATGNVSSGNDSQKIGGLVGYINNGYIDACYSTTTINAGLGSTSVGGLLGCGGGVSNSYWDTQTSGIETSAGGCGKSTVEMKTAATFIGWNCCGDVLWTIDENNDYPRLIWENQPGVDIPSYFLSDFLTGSGTQENPYQIHTAEQLDMVGRFPCEWQYDKHFILMNDIDLTGYSGDDFHVLGVREFSFRGTFRGNWHVMRNFSYDVESGWHIAVFGDVGSGGIIQDLGIEDVNISGGYDCFAVGGLSGMNRGSIKRCYVAGSINGGDGNSRSLGGLVGWNVGEISECYASVNITGGNGSNRIGGLVGGNRNPIINSYSTGYISGGNRLGGLLGDNQGGTIINCYTTGRITGGSALGGLAGSSYNSSYQTCFWDKESSGQTSGLGVGNDDPDPNDVTGRTTTQMQTESTFTDYGWDFVSETANGTDDVWRLCEDGTSYPKLSWEFPIGDFVCRDGVDLADFGYFSRDWLWDACARTDLNGDCLVDIDDLVVFVDHWLSGAGMAMDIELSLDNSWMYQNLPTATASNLTANVSITDDPMGNSSYTYDWEFVLPNDVSAEPSTINGSGPGDASWTFAAPSCDEPNSISDSGQPFTVRVTVTGDDYGNMGIAEAQFGITLLGDVNNDTLVNDSDREIINSFWRTGEAGPFTFRDCNLNCDGAVNVADRSIANAVWRGVLGENRVSSPCPLR